MITGSGEGMLTVQRKGKGPRHKSAILYPEFQQILEKSNIVLMGPPLQAPRQDLLVDLDS